MRTVNTLDDYETFITEHEKVIMVFMSSWCSDCDYLMTFLPRIETLYKEYSFAVVDRESVALLSNHYNVFGVPSFLVYDKGEIIETYIDKKRKTFEDVVTFLERLDFSKGRG